MAKITTIKGAEDRGKYFELVLVGDRGEQVKRLYKKADYSGPGEYEINWKKNSQGFWNIEGMVKAGSSPARNGNGNGNGNGYKSRSEEISKTELFRNVSIVYQKGLGEAVNLYAAVFGKQSGINADAAEWCVKVGKQFGDAILENTKAKVWKKPEPKPEPAEEDADLDWA